MHTIKIQFNYKEKVFEAPSNYEDFKELCKNEFGIDNLENYSVMYKHDEQDEVNIENNEDYSQAIKYIKDISNILEIEIQEKINQSKTYETNEINNDDLEPMRSGAIFDKIMIYGNNNDNDNNNKELNMNLEMKKYLMEMEKKLKEAYSKKFEDDMKEKSIKLQQFCKEKAAEEEKKKNFEEELSKLKKELEVYKKKEEEEKKKKEKEEKRLKEEAEKKALEELLN